MQESHIHRISYPCKYVCNTNIYTLNWLSELTIHIPTELLYLSNYYDKKSRLRISYPCEYVFNTNITHQATFRIGHFTFLWNYYNSFGPIADISVMRLSASWCHFQRCPLEIGSASAERAGYGEVGNMAVSGPVFRKDLVGTGRAISLLFGVDGVRRKWSHVVGPPFSVFKSRFSATAGWHFSRDLTRWLLIGGCG